LHEAVSLLGSLDAEALASEYSQAAVVALPSRQEVAPMAIIEAMAAGVPVVASAVGGVPYLVEDGVTGRTVPPADPAALAEALAELLRQPQTAQRMGEAGRAAARQRFRPEVIAGQYLALYREVARL
jgi:glycosyltransferase involved in cell wall biosynthesis